jgi:hypothetical protein
MNTTSVQLYSIAVPRAQRVNFSISQYYMCEYSSKRPREDITIDFIGGLITNNFRHLYVPNKVPIIPNEKAFSNDMFPINVKKMMTSNR